MLIGNSDTGSFDLGHASESRKLYIVFTVCTFVMLIHLLNMLIAIMGETFGTVTEEAEQSGLQEQVGLIADFSWLVDLKKAFKG